MLQVRKGLHSRARPQGRDEKEAKAGTTPPTMENEAWRDHFGSVHGGPVLRQRKDKKMTKEDKRTGRQTGRGGGWGKEELRGGDVQSRRVSPPCCHTKGGSIRIGLKDGGKREKYLFFFFPPLRWSRCPYRGSHSRVEELSFCCCRHNVSNIFVQLTEGRPAPDQPKQPPAKKNTLELGSSTAIRIGVA